MTAQLLTRGRVWLFGDLVNIDQICATRYLTQSHDVWADHTFEELIPDFRQEARQGDIVVAGEGFAYGMGHDHPIVGMRECGVFGVIAKSFGPQFYRAAIAHGMPLMEVADTSSFHHGMTVEADFGSGRVQLDGETIVCTPLDGPALEIVRAGNLVSFLRQELATR
jgi:3-isopropylmalate/(R)-2-methylmalate dehydratase small subunit